MPELPLRLAVVEPAAELPTGAFEYSPKLDGWRCVVHVPGGMLQSRTGGDLIDRFPGSSRRRPRWAGWCSTASCARIASAGWTSRRSAAVRHGVAPRASALLRGL
ncbi:hypothetical protein [Amycolatopsis sp. NPDC051903]|uniref:hypothetical protein n=1 Tax=Amycolatopsis sp. NPDC051903 TaxID=3363936 RepID=UPI0037AD07EA